MLYVLQYFILNQDLFFVCKNKQHMHLISVGFTYL